MTNSERHYIHSSGHLSQHTTYQLHIFGPNQHPTAKELQALVRKLEMDIEVLSGQGFATGQPLCSTEGA